MNNIKYIALFLSCIALQAMAQDNTEENTLGSEDIIVIKEYEARIADAQKLEKAPNTKAVKVEKQAQKYIITEKLLPLKYPAHEVRPLAKPKVKPLKYLDSYAKLGLGLHFGENKKIYFSPLAEIVYNNDDVKNLIFGGHYKHFSALAGKKASQKFRTENAQIYAQYFLKNVEMSAKVHFKQNEDFYYGYPLDTVRESKQIRQTINRFGSDIVVQNAKINKLELNYSNQLGFLFLSDAYQNKEWNLNYKGTLTKTFKNFHYLDVMLGTNISNFIPPNTDDLEREIFEVGASYTFNNDDWKVKGGINLAMGEVAFDKQFDFYPIIYTEKKLYKDYIIFYSSWRRDLKINSYNSLLAENPYINPQNVNLRNSRIEDRIGGFKGSVQNLTYNVRFSNKVVADMPLFVNDSINNSQFNIVYEKILKSYDINIEASYLWTKNLRTQLSFDYRIFDPTFEAKAWHLPALTANLSATYMYKNRLFIDLEFYALANAFAKNKQGEAEKLPGTADINLGARYKISKNFSTFAKLNNLAHSKQTRFYQYKNYGFNFLIGGQFEF